MKRTLLKEFVLQSVLFFQMNQFHNEKSNKKIQIKLISTSGVRFPWARLQSPRHCETCAPAVTRRKDTGYWPASFLRGFQLVLIPLERLGPWVWF